MARAGKMARTVLGSAALVAIPASAAVAVPEPGGNNDSFPGLPASAGVTYLGSLCFPGGCSPSDSSDFYHYTGLPSGGSFDLSFDPTDLDVCCGDSLIAGLYDSAGPPIDSISSGGPLVHLTGLIPGSGALTFGVTGPGALDVEGYNLTLNVQAPRVPAPPALALLAAGLIALSLEVARRRKRG